MKLMRKMASVHNFSLNCCYLRFLVIDKGFVSRLMIQEERNKEDEK